MEEQMREFSQIDDEKYYQPLLSYAVNLGWMGDYVIKTLSVDFVHSIYAIGKLEEAFRKCASTGNKNVVEDMLVEIETYLDNELCWHAEDVIGKIDVLTSTKLTGFPVDSVKPISSNLLGEDSAWINHLFDLLKIKDALKSDIEESLVGLMAAILNVRESINTLFENSDTNYSLLAAVESAYRELLAATRASGYGRGRLTIALDSMERFPI